MTAKVSEQVQRHLGDQADEKPEKVRLTADLPAKDADALLSLAERLQYNKVTTLSRAIRTLDMLEHEHERGAKVYIERENGERVEILLP